jgi:hypothetical protein
MSVTSTPIRFDAPEVTVACSTGSGSTAVALGKRGQTIELKNFGLVEAYLNVGTSGVTASSSNTLIPAGQTLLYLLAADETHIAGMTTAGVTSVRVKIGEGI